MFDEAIQEYQGVLEKNPSHAKALFNLGNLYAQLGDYTKATEFFERVIASEPNNAEAWNNVGSIHEITGQDEEAIAAYQKSLALNPFQEEANVNLAYIQYKQYRANPEVEKREEIILRLHFILSINPQKTRAKNLLEELTKEGS
jgi:tetratricopeptide (TPR) repeat protein